MKYKIFRIVALFLILANLSSCFEGRWANYHNKHHYIKKKKNYRRMHERRNRDW